MEIRDYNVYDEREILPLYASVGWTNYTECPEMLKAAYHNSLCILGAYEGADLVGIIRAVGDGASIVLIQDIIVLPEYQRRGIGTMLLHTLVQRYASVYQMQLMTDHTEKTIAFYKSAGFVPADDYGCCAFMRM